MDRREAIENIPPEAWIQRRSQQQGYLSLWDLHPKWLTACFGWEYQRAYRDTDPWKDVTGTFGFFRQDNTYEFLIFSKTSPLHCYEFTWNQTSTVVAPTMDGLAREGLEATRQNDNPALVLLRDRQTGEVVQLHVEMLESGSAPARAAREAASLEPWRRALSWYLVVRNNDPETYMRRVHAAFRQFLESVPLNTMTMEQLQFFQQQRLLPEILPDAGPENLPQLMAEIQQQRACFNSPHGNRVPRVLLGIDPHLIELVDVQALMMMGAVKELKSFVDRELIKLGKTNPEIKRLWNTPNGRAQVLAHPAVQAIMNHPEALKEKQDAMHAAWRQMGQQNGMAYDIEQMIANQQMQQMWNGGGGGGNEPPPPWKIYQPFDPEAPQQQQGPGAGFNLGGVLSRFGF
ncbi:MAG: hypothetical protein K0Q72_3994 [Armatimonadetes bacterium]|nr:hypothetical protein [Armatimonadota bacterium]